MYCAPNSQSYNFTHMFDMKDINGRLPLKKPCPNTLLDIIQNHSDFKKFNYLLKLSKQDQLLNSSQANFTMFVPSDMFLEKNNITDDLIINIDPTTAWFIVKTSMIKNKIPSELLEDSPASYYYTLNTANRLFITNISGNTYINNTIRIIKKDIMATNGIIHVIDNLLYDTVIL